MQNASTPKRMVIVGNGPVGRDLSTLVDAADFVLRFNEPKASVGMTGVRTDRLMMANSAKQMQQLIDRPDFLASPIFVAAREIVFPYHPDIVARYFPRPNFLSRLKGRRADWTWPALLKLGAAGKEIRIMPPRFYEDGCRALGLPREKMDRIFPSTGFFGIWHALETLGPDWRIEICGFTWQGWRKHAWADERKFVTEQVERGRIVLLDPDAA